MQSENAPDLFDHRDVEGQLPWRTFHAHTLQTLTSRLDLDGGLVSEDSILALPKGWVLAWDVSRYTSRLESLGPEAQVLMAQEIMRKAVGLALRHRVPMLEPVAGDQASYFLEDDRGDELDAMLRDFREMRIEAPGGELSVKVVALPVEEQAVFVSSFLDRKQAGVQRGYAAVTGPGAVTLIKKFKHADPNSVSVHRDRVPGLQTDYPLYEPRLFLHGTLAVEEALRPLTEPQFPTEQPYDHLVLHAKGRVSLTDPLHSAHLARAFFGNAPDDFTPLKQNDGILHVAVPSRGGDPSPRFEDFLYRMNGALDGISVRGLWTHVENPLAVSWGSHMRDGVGTPIARVIHQLKRKGVPDLRVYSREAI